MGTTAKEVNILFVGANEMPLKELEVKQITSYEKGLFIEAIPNVFEKLKHNLNICNKKHNTSFVALNKLVSDDEKEYIFNILRRDGQSSSIFEPGKKFFRSVSRRPKARLSLTSEKISTILEEHGWTNLTFDLILDVQGAELKALKGFGDYLSNAKKIETEITKDKETYKGGVLFAELHDFLIKNNFRISEKYLNNEELNMDKIPWHGNVRYYNKKYE